MSAALNPQRPAPRAAFPSLELSVRDASSLPHAAVPTLAFALAIDARGGHDIRSILLDVQIQIAARRRGYEPAEEDRLLELFGPVADWGTNLRTLPWLRTTAVIPPFTGSTEVQLHVPCTYDLQVTAARYFAALADGIVPLELLFSGSVFFAGDHGSLQTARIGWDREAEYALPVAVWRQAMDQHFPHTAWLRVDEETFARLCAYKARHAFTGWDDTIDALLGTAALP